VSAKRRRYLPILTQTAGLSLDGLAVRWCITKGAFAELRAACVRRGGDLTGEFLDLEREIDSPTVTQGMTIRMGKARRSGRAACLDRKEGGRSARKNVRAIFRIGRSAGAFCDGGGGSADRGAGAPGFAGAAPLIAPLLVRLAGGGLIGDHAPHCFVVVVRLEGGLGNKRKGRSGGPAVEVQATPMSSSPPWLQQG
jgi:hypothetical protein